MQNQPQNFFKNHEKRRTDLKYKEHLTLLPHVVGASWATVGFRMEGIRKPTREEFREKTLEYLKMVEPVFESYPKNEDYAEICKYIEFRKKQEYEKIISGENNEIEN